MTSASPRARASRRLDDWLAATLLLVGTVALFSRALPYDFSNYDDPRYVTHNPHVQHGLTWSAVRWAFTANADYWHPLTWLSHVLDWSLFGDVAAGHHATSVLWHAATAVAAFVVLRRISISPLPATVAVALFAWHPLRVESVVWITERKDVMSGFFFLLTLACYLRYAERRQRRQSHVGAYLGALGSFAAGLTCKPTLVALPGVLLVLDGWPLRRLDAADLRSFARQAWPLLREKLPFFALSFATAIATVQMQRDVGAFTLSVPFAARLGNVPVALARYLGKFFWPTDLAVCYPHPGWWPGATIAGATILVLAISTLAWRARRTRPWLAAGWAWFLIMLFPTIGLMQVGFQSMADRYTYLPMLGFALALAGVFEAMLTSARRNVITAAAVAIVATVAALTWRQQAVWRDSATLFRHAIAVTGPNSVAEAFLGHTLAAAGKLEEAAEHSARAITLDHQNESAIFTLAEVRDRQNRLDDAIAGYRRALELKPGEWTTAYALGLVLIRADRIEEATTALRNAAGREPRLPPENLKSAEGLARSGQWAAAYVRFRAATLLQPEHARAHFGAGQCAARIGRHAEAHTLLRQAIALDGNFVPARLEFGFLLLARQEPQAAREQFRAALAADDGSGTAHLGLAKAEDALGNSAAATAELERALALAPADADVNRAWAESLARRGRFTDAIGYYRRAAQAKPQDAATHAGLGFVLFLSDRKSEAVAAWKEALRLDPAFPGLRERLQKLGETAP